MIGRLALPFLGLLLATAPNASAQSDIQEKINRVYQNAIVKIVVSGTTPVFDADGKNLCDDEGTGFIVSNSVVLTAFHVVDRPEDCGRVVIVRSRPHGFEAPARYLGHVGDVVALEADFGMPETGLCALRMESSNNEEVLLGVRFALPSTIDDPVVMAARIDPAGSLLPDFRFTPFSVEKGDSGGPLIHVFHVVGMTRAKLPEVTGYGLMIPAEEIAKLTAALGLVPDPVATCDLHRLTFAEGLRGITLRGTILEAGSVRSEIRDALLASIEDGSDAYNQTIAAADVALSPSSLDGAEIGLTTRPLSREEAVPVREEVEDVIARTLWSQYIESFPPVP